MKCLHFIVFGVRLHISILKNYFTAVLLLKLNKKYYDKEENIKNNKRDKDRKKY